MPNNSHYNGTNDLGHQYPTIFEYEERANVDGLAIIDEIYYESHFLSNAMVKPTNDGMRERFKRETEKVKSGHVASLDEGYYGKKKTAPLEEKSFGTMRISDQLTWEKKQSLPTEDNGSNLKAKQLKDATDYMLDLKVDKMLYSNSADDKDAEGNAVTTKDKGKQINGLFTYLEKTFTTSKYNDLIDRYDGKKNPFTNTKEDLLCFSNYSASRTGKGSDYTEASKFTSILGVAFGVDGVVTVFPEIVGTMAGYGMDYKADLEAHYEEDGIMKSYEYDRCNFDAYFGIGVKNRYCLNAVRNVYLGHSDKRAIFEEMESVENYLIMLKDFFDLGHTGMTLQFYCNPRLITQMEMYQKEKYLGYGNGQYNAVGSRDFNGMNPRVRPTTIQIAHDIVLNSDRVFKTNEKYVGGTIGTI